MLTWSYCSGRRHQPRLRINPPRLPSDDRGEVRQRRHRGYDHDFAKDVWKYVQRAGQSKDPDAQMMADLVAQEMMAVEGREIDDLPALSPDSGGHSPTSPRKRNRQSSSETKPTSSSKLMRKNTDDPVAKLLDFELVIVPPKKDKGERKQREDDHESKDR